MNFLTTMWTGVRLYARDCGEIDPYDVQSTALFRGEEAFAPEVTGWKRWSKPSPEPHLNAAFEPILLAAISHQAPALRLLLQVLAEKIIAANERPPVLIAVLRAGVPICAALAPLLAAHYGEEIPICAFSLFYGLGWDEAALDAIVADFPERNLLFVDGWSSGGGVAAQLKVSFEAWRSKGKTDFTGGRGLQFAVLCDPRGKATFSALRADFFVPSAAFTAPETLGFSRGFAFEDGGLFGVYTFPEEFRQPLWIEHWLQIGQSRIGALPHANDAAPFEAPAGFRVHVNEVTRALINRDPLEIWLCDAANEIQETLAPLLYLAQKRAVPVRFGCSEVASWGAIAAAKMR